MPTIDFPASPTLNQEYGFEGCVWRWNNSGWEIKPSLVLPAIGSALNGGFYAGLISHTANGVATHALIVAPRATGATGTGYPIGTRPALKTSDTTTTGTNNEFDGAVNTAAMVSAGIADHPAANFCVGLSINGYSDWYLPSIYELDIAYQNLKPTDTLNNTSSGTNFYSVPARTVNRTAGAPARTSLTAFQSGGAQAFAEEPHWSSTESPVVPNGWIVAFTNGSLGAFAAKTLLNNVRAFRKIAL
jgi:hypothetical protein